MCILKLIIFSFFFLSFTTSSQITFEELQSENYFFIPEQSVQIKGFIYQSPWNTFILASQPNLKSCCIDNSHQAAQQIFLKGIDKISTNQMVTVQGILKLQVQEEGKKLRQFYILENAEIISQKVLPFWTLIFCFIFIIFTFFVFKKKQKT
ncbi:hypothetical protein [Candidatus Protochlamydia sp. W-9]|uniref:hypothetical protein n=1 Tax=Candidatus Protochlamydia sp. W-9 TaxID=1785087 RepID=UPI00096A5436|nr:hypothetical protein [Candidatus Protochlamydia sp. W-9]